MPVGDRIAPGVFAGQEQILHQEIAHPGTDLGRKDVRGFVFVEGIAQAQLVDEERTVQVQVADVPGTDVEEELRILAEEITAGGRQPVVDALIEQERDQHDRMDGLVAVDDRVSERKVEPFPGSEGEQVGGNELLPVHNAVADSLRVDPGAVDGVGNQPAVEVVEIEPARRLHVEADVGVAGHVVRQDVRAMVVVAPDGVVFQQAHTPPLPTHHEATAHFVKITAAVGIGFVVRCRVLVQVQGVAQSPGLAVVAQAEIETGVRPDVSPGLSSVPDLPERTGVVAEQFAAQDRVDGEGEQRILVVEQIESGLPSLVVAQALSGQVHFTVVAVAGFVRVTVDLEFFPKIPQIEIQFLLLSRIQFASAAIRFR